MPIWLEWFANIHLKSYLEMCERFILAYPYYVPKKDSEIDDKGLFEKLMINEDFIEITGHTNFEDEREYFINGYENNNSFIAQGMDGKLTLNNNILPSNLWNINMLNQKEIFDTQKGIVREIDVKDLGDEKIIINEKKINCKKFTLNASSNPKDKGPFPEYTLWYDHKDELMKFEFINWRDKKVVTLIRKLQEED